MNIGWIGAHLEGVPALRALLDRGVDVEIVMTLSPDAAARRSGATADAYRALCQRFGVPLHEIENVNDASAMALLRACNLDLIFVIGWSQILRPAVLKLARVGVIGAHASLLPRDRGRAPINWALIRGDASTGNTLFWLSEGVDAGDIIDQAQIPISPYDTCATLYRQVAITNRDMILRAMPALLAGERPGRPQGAAIGPPLPGRRPEDGAVDWSRRSDEIYDFVRALSRPYPGAFSHHGLDRFTIWRSALLPPALQARAGAPPGAVLGPLVSPDARACGQVIACGDGGAIVLLEIELASHTVIRGRSLSELQWTGQVLGRHVEVPLA